MLDPGYRRQTLLQPLMESYSLGVIRVLCPWQADLRCHQSVHTPARVEVGEALQPAQEEARAGEQNQRERDFADDQRVTQALMRAARARSAHVLPQRMIDIRARGQPGRNR